MRSNCFEHLQEFVLKKIFAKNKTPAKFSAGSAQLKLTAMVSYYIIVGVIGLTSFTYFEANDSSRERITEYILCESSGVSANCAFESYDPIISGLSSAVIILISLMPVLALLFSFKYKKCKRNRDTGGKKSFQRSNTATSQV